MGLDEEVSSQRKVYSRHELLPRSLDAAACREKREHQLKQHTIFAHELQTALRLTVEFSNIYCEM